MATRRKRITYSPTAERRAVLYARYSSSLQADSWSIDAQVADLRAHCERMGWQVLPDVCLDEAITGSTDQRPGLDQAMSLIREGHANVLVVHKLDRFFRNMAKTFEYVAELEEYGAGLVCTQQPIDTTNPVSGKIVLAVMAALAEIYLDNLSEETAKGKKARAAGGLPNGILPFGYRLPAKMPKGAANRSVALVVPEEAEAVRLAFDLYASGQYGDAKIARTLNDRGYSIRSKWQPDGGRFTRDAVAPILANPFYAGWVVQPTQTETASWRRRLYDAPRVRGLHEAIIPQELFDHVQAMRTARYDSRRGPVRPQRHHAYIAAGLVHCHVCGKRLRAQGADGRNAHYRCNYAQRGGVCDTKRKSLDANLVDGLLGAAVTALRLPDDWRARVMDTAEREGVTGLSVEAQRNALARKLDHVKRLLLDGDIDQATYRAERARLDAELASIAPPPELIDREKAAELLANLPALWEGADDEDRKQLAGLVVESIYVHPDRPQDVYVVIKPALHPVMAALPACSYRVIDGHPSRKWYTANLIRLSGERPARAA